VREDAPYRRNRLARRGLNSELSDLVMMDLYPYSKKS